MNEMSVMDYGLGRRFTPHNVLSFPDYYCDERNASFALSHVGREDLRSYRFGGPVGGNRGRSGAERDEITSFDGGPSRRRIAVAVSARSSHHSAPLACAKLQDSDISSSHVIYPTQKLTLCTVRSVS
jgi:hypothetical protein